MYTTQNKPQQQQDTKTIRQISQIIPAMDLISKNYSLEPDMISGWKPKIKVVGPIPLNFDNTIIDKIVQELTSFGGKNKQRVIYLGLRPSSSYKMHQDIKHQYQYKYAHLYTSNYNHLTAFFRKFYSNFQSKKTRLFKGVNPTINIQQQFIFDSSFQSGNLDAVIKVGPNQYDLFMRNDSNTRGHNQWFNFTIKNNIKKKIKINICNFRNQGMKPYIFSRYLNDTKKIGWMQGGSNIKFQKLPLRYNFMYQEGYFKQQLTYSCLQFDYIFQTDYDQVGFAYAPPYTYSNLMDFIKQLISQTKQYSKGENIQIIKQVLFCQSLSGLTIPLLTITDPNTQDIKKKCVLVAARIHPGQSNSNYMLQGFLKYICGNNNQANYLRENIVFKIIPMVNPDGVVLGNFRTSLSGKDLNRVFKSSMDLLYPQVKSLKQLTVKLKQQFRGRLQLFLDFHGHSVKKNVFIYGPEYGICQTNYYKTRMLPKIISNKTQMFRYYSCMFRISYFKKATARAVLLKNIPHCYTIQASNSCYYSLIQKKDIDFTPQKWIQMGQCISESIVSYMKHIQAQRLLQIQKKKKILQNKQLKKKRNKAYYINSFGQPQSQYKSSLAQNRQDFALTSKFNNHKNIRLNSLISIDDFSKNTSVYETLTKDIPQQTRKLYDQINKIQECKHQSNQGHQSDRFSEGRSDSEDKSDDLDDKVLNKLHNNIINTMQQFEAKFFKKKIRETKSKKQTYQNNQKKSKNKIKYQIKQTIDIIPCLRKKAVETQTKQTKDSQLKKVIWPKIQQNNQLKGSNLQTVNRFFTNTNLGSLVSSKPFLNRIMKHISSL